jgi:hypothetical protein
MAYCVASRSAGELRHIEFTEEFDVVPQESESVLILLHERKGTTRIFRTQGNYQKYVRIFRNIESIFLFSSEIARTENAAAVLFVLYSNLFLLRFFALLCFFTT